MKKITPFMFIFFVGFVISIASLTSYKKNPSIVCETSQKIELSVEDIIDTNMMNKKSPQRKAFNAVAGFNRSTYKRPIKYYIHDKTGRIKFKILSSNVNYAYEMTDDEEQFIVDAFNKIDSYVDLDFKREFSRRKATIGIYKSTPHLKDSLGIEQSRYWYRPYRYKTEIVWHEMESDKTKLNNYPTLSYSSATTLMHEITHALGLSHVMGDYYPNNIDPFDTRINKKDTIMSYRNPSCFSPEKEDDFLTELDIKALRTLWGVEKDN